MALHCWAELWELRHSRDEEFHILLSWTGGGPSVQEWMTILIVLAELKDEVSLLQGGMGHCVRVFWVIYFMRRISMVGFYRRHSQ